MLVPNAYVKRQGMLVMKMTKTVINISKLSSTHFLTNIDVAFILVKVTLIESKRSLSVLMQLCKSPEYPIKAARLTRISSMHELQHIAGDETLDVKILYVVRDPAGMNQSLIKSKKSTELEAYCYQELLKISFLDILC